MHCVLLGVFPELLKLCYHNLSNEDKQQFKTVLSNLTCPREVIAYSKKIGPLDEIAHFKANEYYNWLLYISPVVFRKRIPNELYSLLMNLVSAIRILLESSNTDHILIAERLLENFCGELLKLHGNNERREKINVHSLRRLADQVKRFDPFVCFPAMGLEAANRTLGEAFSGAKSECEAVCRRVLQRHRLTEYDITDACLLQF